MNMHNTELQRQAATYQQVRARLWGKKAPQPVVKIEPDVKIEPIEEKPKRKDCQADYHVWLYRIFKIRYGITTRATLSIAPSQDYLPYTPVVSFDLEPPHKPMRQIALEVLENFPGVSLEEIKGSLRHRSIVEPRQLAMYEVQRQRPDLSYPAIGRFFHKDHTTVLHAVRKIKAMKARAAE